MKKISYSKNVLSALAILIFASNGFATTTVKASDANAVCRLPFEQIVDPKTGAPFPMSAAQNEPGLAQNLRLRYIVGDFNSTDAHGRCRGVQELFSKSEFLSDFAHLHQLAVVLKVQVVSFDGQTVQQLSEAADALKDVAAKQSAQNLLNNSANEIRIELEDLHNFQQQVARFYSKPVSKHGVQNGFCIGENLNYCEIRNPQFDSTGQLVGGEPALIYKFVTSTSRALPPRPGYYAPINFIHTRHWSSDRTYGAGDAARDERLGGGLSTLAMFRNGGSPEEMPNFLNFVPMPGYPGETQNGIHEIAGGLDSGGKFGAPVSLGCVRLNKYQAKLSRWWTPQGARFFIYMDPDRYFQRADAEGDGVRATVL